MKVLTCHNGQLHAAHSEIGTSASSRSFVTGFSAFDELLPNGAFARGAVHELLAIPSHPSPFFVALFIARATMIQPQMNADERGLKDRKCGTRIDTNRHESSQIQTEWIRGDSCSIRDNSCFDFFDLRSSASICGSNNLRGAIVWCDPQGKLYPPAVAAMGVPLDRLFLLRPKTIPDENWAIAECLRCRGVSATIASPRRLSRIEARRFQLAAERGRGIGILLRPYDRTANVYSAATRWLVSPQRGLRTVQRWRIELIHGHGGQIGQAVILEHHRETNSIQILPLRAFEQLADRPVPAPARATA
ncbi:hypothetical protein BH09PLA1_BH09PLA1_20890 [soil metagenome]